MKKTIWMPFVLGITLGALSLLSSTVRFVVPIGNAGAIGPHEIFATLSAAMGGPLGLLVTSILHTLGAHTYLMARSAELEQIPLGCTHISGICDITRPGFRQSRVHEYSDCVHSIGNCSKHKNST